MSEQRSTAELSRERRLSAAFVTLADTLVDDYDIVELLHELVEKCTELLGVDAAGLMLADADGRLQVVASTSEQAERLEATQVAAGEGPCIEALTTGDAVSVDDLETIREKWPDFYELAVTEGIRSVHAIPLRLRSKTIGAMNVFSTRIGQLDDNDLLTARALADVATIGILQERLIRESTLVTEQLQYALESRVVIEQAKGVLAQATSTGLDQAFVTIREYSRRNRRSVRSVAEALVGRSISSDEIMHAPAAKAKS